MTETRLKSIIAWCGQALESADTEPRYRGTFVLQTLMHGIANRLQSRIMLKFGGSAEAKVGSVLVKKSSRPRQSIPAVLRTYADLWTHKDRINGTVIAWEAHRR
jgi:hypothetical protein